MSIIREKIFPANKELAKLSIRDFSLVSSSVSFLTLLNRNTHVVDIISRLHHKVVIA